MAYHANVHHVATVDDGDHQRKGGAARPGLPAALGGGTGSARRDQENQEGSNPARTREAPHARSLRQERPSVDKPVGANRPRVEAEQNVVGGARGGMKGPVRPPGEPRAAASTPRPPVSAAASGGEGQPRPVPTAPGKSTPPVSPRVRGDVPQARQERTEKPFVDGRTIMEADRRQDTASHVAALRKKSGPHAGHAVIRTVRVEQEDQGRPSSSRTIDPLEVADAPPGVATPSPKDSRPAAVAPRPRPDGDRQVDRQHASNVRLRGVTRSSQHGSGETTSGSVARLRGGSGWNPVVERDSQRVIVVNAGYSGARHPVDRGTENAQDRPASRLHQTDRLSSADGDGWGEVDRPGRGGTAPRVRIKQSGPGRMDAAVPVRIRVGAPVHGGQRVTTHVRAEGGKQYGAPIRHSPRILVGSQTRTGAKRPPEPLRIVVRAKDRANPGAREDEVQVVHVNRGRATGHRVGFRAGRIVVRLPPCSRPKAEPAAKLATDRGQYWVAAESELSALATQTGIPTWVAVGPPKEEFSHRGDVFGLKGVVDAYQDAQAENPKGWPDPATPYPSPAAVEAAAAAPLSAGIRAEELDNSDRLGWDVGYGNVDVMTGVKAVESDSAGGAAARKRLGLEEGQRPSTSSVARLLTTPEGTADVASAVLDDARAKLLASAKKGVDYGELDPCCDARGAKALGQAYKEGADQFIRRVEGNAEQAIAAGEIYAPDLDATDYGVWFDASYASTLGTGLGEMPMMSTVDPPSSDAATAPDSATAGGGDDAIPWTEILGPDLDPQQLLDAITDDGSAGDNP